MTAIYVFGVFVMVFALVAIPVTKLLNRASEREEKLL